MYSCELIQKGMNTLTSLLFLYLYNTNCKLIDVYSSPGTFEDYLKMTKHPGKTDFPEISVCLRYFNLFCILKFISNFKDGMHSRCLREVLEMK